MSSEISRPALHYEDFAIGQSWITAPLEVSAQAVRDYAEAWDPLPIHIDETAAAASPHGGLIASGEHTFVIMRRALWDLGLLTHANRVVTQNKLRFLAPVRPGDRLSIKATCTEKRSTERRDVGLVALEVEVTNQADVVVLSCDETHEIAFAPEA